MGRYRGTLHKLVEQGPLKKGNWNLLLNYLEGHAILDKDAVKPPFESPLPPFTKASNDLQRELLSAQGPKQDETPLRIATLVKACPSNVMAALCHLCPEAAALPDGHSRLPLHWACRKPTNDNESEQAMFVLLAAYPQGLLHRDDCGRLPLHYLFWYHADTRSVKLVERFLQDLPPENFVGLTQMPGGIGDPLPPIPRVGGDIPSSAAIVPDAKHGCLPLHYAVMGGASKEVVKLLLQNYPQAKFMQDRKGRSALAWYFGAGDGLHVSGESPDPNAIPLYDTKLSSNIVHLLLTSKVARIADVTGRTPIHWVACLLAKHYYLRRLNATCLSTKVVQMLLDHFAEGLIAQDKHGKTPLHLLFDVVAEQQNVEWQRLERNQLIRTEVDLRTGQIDPVYAPPLDLVELLLRCPDAETHRCAAHVEDEEGRLPLHAALSTGTSTSVIRVMIQSYPTALVHTTDQTLQTPLHAALASPFTAPLQTKETITQLLQAYVTSRHGTFVNGKLALKLEDSYGMYPLHYACQNQACLNVVSILVDHYPRACKFQNGNGDLPVHCLLEQDAFFSSSEYAAGGAPLALSMGWISEGEDSLRLDSLQVVQEKIKATMGLLATDQPALKIGSSAHGMTPLHIAIAFDAVPYSTLYRLLETHPTAMYAVTTTEGHMYSPLDLHDLRRPVAKDESRWNQIYELLFSFGTLLETHRHKDELLEQCAQLVLDEISGIGSPHLDEWIEIKNISEPFPDLGLNDTLSTVTAPEIDAGTKPVSKSQRPPPRAAPRVKHVDQKKMKKKPKPKSPQKGPKKSIYDDDGTGGYVVSADSGDDSDEDDFFDDGRDEEYDSEDASHDSDSGNFDDVIRTDNSPRNGTQSFDDELTVESPNVEEKKQEEPLQMSGANGQPDSAKAEEKPFLSEVALRIFAFFVLYRNPTSVHDNYAKQVDIILDALDFKIAEKLISLNVPPFALTYVGKQHGSTFAEAANNFCRQVIHKLFYFMERFEFLHDEAVLIYKSDDGQTVLVRALEHLVNVEEVKEERKETPGDVEATIWQTGEVPAETPLNSCTNYFVTSRKVCFKFMKSQQAYDRELFSRQILGVSTKEGDASTSIATTPLLDHYTALGLQRKSDLRYKRDCQDERFSTVQMGISAGLLTQEDKILTLSDYPFAFVLPLVGGANLYDYFVNHGKMTMTEIREVGTDVGQALKKMHENGLVHANVSVHHITSVIAPPENDEQRARWTLTELSSTCRQSSDSYMAGIAASGVANFSSGNFPPELFTRLTPGELGIYNHYWKTVESDNKISIDRNVISPQIDAATGESYVLKCYYMGNDTSDLPPLPYLLVPARETADIWSFGRALFMLCSSGHPLFPTNIKTGHLLAYDQVANWDHEKARAMVFKYVSDPLAQDLLLHLLATYEDRSALQMETVLIHPFFTQKANDPTTEKMLKRIIEQRSTESRMYMRSQEVKDTQQAGEQWLSGITKTVVCWDLDFQVKMQLSPSNLVKLECSTGRPIADMPLSLLLLPYKLLRGKSGKLTPSTKKDVERAERMGIQLLALSKACRFAGLMGQVVADSEDNGAHKWSSSEVSAAMALSSDEFKVLEEEMVALAAREVELFRDDPMSIARRLVQERIKELRACFDESQKGYLYLVDEYEGVPIVELDTPYPHEATDKISQLFLHALPLMHMSTLYMRGIAGSVTGLVKLIFEAAYPHIPPSWAAASAGLEHILDEERMTQEVKLLRRAIADLYGSSRGNDDLQFLQGYLQTFDPLNTYSNLKRVSNGESSMWTSQQGMDKIDHLAKESSIEKARLDQAAQRHALIMQEQRIMELEKALENLEFRNAHQLGPSIATHQLD